MLVLDVIRALQGRAPDLDAVHERRHSETDRKIAHTDAHLDEIDARLARLERTKQLYRRRIGDQT
jgi:hypothetical protein